MNQKLGSKNGKNNIRIFFLNLKRKLIKDNLKEEEKKKKDELLKDENKKIEEINIQYSTKRKKKSLEKNTINKTTTIKQKQNIYQVKQHQNNDKENIITNNKNTNINIPATIEPQKIINNDKKQEEVKKTISTKPKEKNKQKTQKIIYNKEYLEKQIIKILYDEIDENRYNLKKLDSEIHTIEKEIDNIDNKEDILELEKEIDELIKKITIIKKQIESLQKTFELDFPVDIPDNYLIFLVDEYKNKIKTEKELTNKLNENKEFKSIIDRIIEIEEKKELLLAKKEEKITQLDLDNEQVKKMNDNIINIEEMEKQIKKMLTIQNKLLEDIKIKVNETVHISEKVDYISKTVNHSILELFTLMAILKHNLSIKNNVTAAVTAKLALDKILKMTTPIQEKKITKVNDVSDYKKLIDSCLNDTNKLENIINENIDNISSIRYTFEHDYKSCSYLPNYQEVIDKLVTLEDEMKERKHDINKIKKETELQLEKNNAKVRKYGSMVA